MTIKACDSPAIFGFASPDRQRRQLLAGAGVALAAALLRPPLTHAQTPAPIDVVLAAPGPGSAVSYPVELAVKLGFDRAAGVNLRLKFVSGGGVAIKDIQAGDVEFGVFGLPAAMAAHLNDPRIVALAAVEDLPVWVMMVSNRLRDKVKRVPDLKGRTLGNHSGALSTKTTGDLISELVLSSHGLQIDSVRSTAVGQSWETQSAAIRSGSVDAIMTDEPFATRMIDEKIAYPIYSTANPADAKRTPGAAFLRAALIGRRDRIDANPAAAERVVRLINRTLTWMSAHSAEQVADLLDLKEAEARKAFIDVYKKYPRQYSRDGKFSTAQLRETEIFFRATVPGNAAAQQFSVDAMIIDRWSGRKP